MCKTLLCILVTGLLMAFSVVTAFAQIEKSKTIRLIYEEEEEEVVKDTLVYEKDPEKALRISLLHTILPLSGSLLLMGANGEAESGSSILFLYGILVGPSTGYFYAKQGGRAVGGILLRSALGIAAVSAGILLALDSAYGGDGDAAASAVLLGGMGLVLISAISDISRVKSLTRKKFGSQSGSRLQILPYPSMQTRSLGLHLRLRF